MATLADVAHRAQVSKATASRALSRPELVAPSTVVRVLAAARELDFVPNRAARFLARGRTGIVAMVVPTLDNRFFTPIIGGAQERAAEADLQLTVTVHPLDTSRDLSSFEHLASQVDGFLIVAPRGDDDTVREAASVKPTILVDREIPGVHSVVADTAVAFGDLASRLHEAGHEHLVYVGGPRGSWQDAQRTAAMRAATEGARLTVLGPCPATFAAGLGVVPEVLDSGATAVVPYATAIGLGLMFGLQRRGVATPGDVLVSLEGEVVDALGTADIPAIDVDGAGLGRTAMQRLLQVLEDSGTPSPMRLPVQVRWPEAQQR